MSKLNQTAVEWLRYLSQHREIDKFDFEQALVMERMQIMDAYFDGCEHKGRERYIGMENYYNNKYGKQTTQHEK